MADGVYAAMYGACRAEVYPAGLEPCLRRFGNDAHELVNSVVFGSRDWHNGYAQTLGQLVYINRAVVAQKFIHHVQRQHHGLAHLYKLKREIQVALDIRCIGDIYYRIGLFVDYEIPGDLLLTGIRTDGVDARQVDKAVIFIADYLAQLMLDRHAREVADMLI